MLRAVHNHLILEILEEENENKYGNIYVADMGKDAPKVGKVISSGEGTLLMNGDFKKNICKVGDKVLFGSYGGVKFTHGGIDYINIKDQEVIAIIED